MVVAWEEAGSYVDSQVSHAAIDGEVAPPRAADRLDAGVKEKETGS